jgi:hypothetical protein
MSRGSRTVPRSTSGTPKRRQYTPKIAFSAATPEIAPKSEFQAAGHRVTLHGRDHGLAEKHARGAHGSIAGFRKRRFAAPGERLQIESGAERVARAGEDGDGECVISVEGAKRVGERQGGYRVDGVADVRPIDGDDRDAATLVELYCRHIRERALV